jgi:hypothetical protein
VAYGRKRSPFGVFEAGSVWQIIATMPEFFWELSLGIWLMVKGFNPTAAILSEPDTTDIKGRGRESEKLSLPRA